MTDLLNVFPWSIQRRIIDYAHHLVQAELMQSYTWRKLNYIKHLRENGEYKFAEFVNDAFRFRDVQFITGFEWNWYEWGLRKIYNGERVWMWIIESTDTYTILQWFKKIYKFKYRKYGFTSVNDYINNSMYDSIDITNEV